MNKLTVEKDGLIILSDGSTIVGDGTIKYDSQKELDIFMDKIKEIGYSLSISGKVNVSIEGKKLVITGG